jgi:two-component system chemotaxis response regulator CheY
MKGRILVVDDESDIRDTILEVLSDEGYDAVGAANGREALDELARSAVLPDAVLLDLRMPVLDGVGFREEQLQDPRLASVPVIVVSANARVREVADELGVAGYLRKPFDLGAMFEILARICTSRSSTED